MAINPTLNPSQRLGAAKDAQRTAQRAVKSLEKLEKALNKGKHDPAAQARLADAQRTAYAALNAARRDVRIATAELDRANQLPPREAPADWEAQAMAATAAPAPEAQVAGLAADLARQIAVAQANALLAEQARQRDEAERTRAAQAALTAWSTGRITMPAAPATPPPTPPAAQTPQGPGFFERVGAAAGAAVTGTVKNVVKAAEWGFGGIQGAVVGVAAGVNDVINWFKSW